MEDKTYNLYLHHENYDHHHHPHQLHDAKPSTTTYNEPLIKKLPFRLTGWRWPALLFMNLLLVGYFAVFDSPQPLEAPIKETLDINDQQYSLLYSCLAIPNVILPIIAGYIVDSIGVRPSMIIFSILVLAGQLLLTYGAYLLSFTVMVAGRVVYSLGADPLNIAQVVMVNRWFKEKELALALSLGTLMGGCGKAINSIMNPIIYEATGNIASPFGFGAMICAFSVLCVFVMVIWDKENEKREITLDPDYFRHAEHSERVNLKDIKKFKPMVWLLVLNFGILDGIVFTMRSFLNDFFQHAYNFTITKAGNLISSHYVIMAICSPLMGKVIDKIGMRASILFYNSFLGFFALLIFVLVPSGDQSVWPVVSLVLLGLYIGFDDAAVFASLPLVLEEKYLGTGYGLYYVVVNIFLTVLPPIAGTITSAFTDLTRGYYWMSTFLFILTIVGVVEAFILLMADKKNNRVLDKTVFKDDDSMSQELLGGDANNADSVGVAKRGGETVIVNNAGLGIGGAGGGTGGGSVNLNVTAGTGNGEGNENNDNQKYSLEHSR